MSAYQITLAFLFVLGYFLVAVIAGFAIFKVLVSVCRWLARFFEERLIGSQERLWIALGNLNHSKERGLPIRFHLQQISGSIIVIRKGWFRRRSAIYGDAAKNWRINGVVKRSGWDSDMVQLQDQFGLPVGEALQLINRYPSLATMLDEIALLKQERDSLRQQSEKQLERANQNGLQLWAAIEALRAALDEDRPRFRSQASEAIRRYLEIAAGHPLDWGGSRPSDEIIENWKRTFRQQMPQVSTRRPGSFNKFPTG